MCVCIIVVLCNFYLCAFRNIDDSFLESIAMFCPEIEQLDILGTNRVSPAGIAR